MMHSALYVGHVRHARRKPVAHTFRYPLYMLYLDLDELPGAARPWPLFATFPALLWFRRADHVGDPRRALATSVLDLVAERAGFRPEGPVRLLTHPRTFGLAFNPVSFFYCFASDRTTLQAIVAEINNTPWNQRHCYVFDARSGVLDFEVPKEFHISPFLGMILTHRFRFTVPGDKLGVGVDNSGPDAAGFEAGLALALAPSPNLAPDRDTLAERLARDGVQSGGWPLRGEHDHRARARQRADVGAPRDPRCLIRDAARARSAVLGRGRNGRCAGRGRVLRARRVGHRRQIGRAHV